MLLVVILVVKVQSRWMEQGEGRREGKEGEGSRERGGSREREEE